VLNEYLKTFYWQK